MKKCYKCKKEKSLNDFKINKTTNKLCSGCIECNLVSNNKGKKYYRENQDKIKEYYKDNRETILIKCKSYRHQNIEKVRQRDRERYEINKERVALKGKERRNTLKYKERMRIYLKTWIKNKRLIDPNFRLISNLRQRIRKVLKTNTKSARTMELLGCTIEFLKQYLESLFKSGMNWDNYGSGTTDKWCVDHIIPCRAFDLSNPEQQRKCFHYTNLQPLWCSDNSKKGDMLPNGKRAKHN